MTEDVLRPTGPLWDRYPTSVAQAFQYQERASAIEFLAHTRTYRHQHGLINEAETYSIMQRFSFP